MPAYGAAALRDKLTACQRLRVLAFGVLDGDRRPGFQDLNLAVCSDEAE